MGVNLNPADYVWGNIRTVFLWEKLQKICNNKLQCFNITEEVFYMWWLNPYSMSVEIAGSGQGLKRCTVSEHNTQD